MTAPITFAKRKKILDLRRASTHGSIQNDGRLSRCTLKGATGDAIFAVVCACGNNIRKILAHLRLWRAYIMAAIWAETGMKNTSFQGAIAT